jgi:hypothetical protein
MRCWVVPVVSVLGLTAPLTAKGQQDSAQRHEVWLGAVGQHGRVSAAGERRRFEGRVIRVAGDSVFIADAGRVRALPMGLIDTLWVRRRATGRGALVGALVGGVPLALALGALCAGYGDDCGNNVTGAAAAGFVIGGGAGALLGSAIGSVVVRWERRIPPTARRLGLAHGNRRSVITIALPFDGLKRHE